MSSTGPAGRPRIVVAEDNPDLLRLVQRRLTRRGYEVLCARDGLEALALIRAERPDAVVLDWVMPEMQGHHVCQAVKQDEELAAIPVLMLTARATEADVVGGFEHGADDFLTKPFDIDELDQRLRQLLRAPWPHSS